MSTTNSAAGLQALTSSASQVAASKLTGYLDALVNELRLKAPRALLEGDMSAIHETRVCTRRLNAAIDLLLPVVSKSDAKAFGRTLKKIRRALGNLRDMDVMGGHLNDLGKRQRSLKSSGVWLSARLKEQRDDAMRKSADPVSAVKLVGKLSAWTDLRRQLDESAGAIDTLLTESLHLQIDTFSEQADQVVAQFRDANPATRHDPHELRITGKALRYTLEMAREEGHDLPGGLFKAFKALQEHLGLWHDFVVLADWCVTTASQQTLSHFDPDAHARVLDVAKASLKKCKSELNAFSALWTEQGQNLSDQIRRAFPLTQPAIPVALTTDPPTTPREASASPDPV